MKVLYRSVSKIRRQGSFYSWITSATVQAIYTFYQFTRTSGIASLIRIIPSTLIIVLLIPIIGLLFFFTAAYKRIVQWILIYRYPDEQLEVVFDSHLRTFFDTSNDYGIVTALVIAKGTLHIEEIRQRFENSICSSVNTKKLLLTKFGCYVWKPTNVFKIENQILLSSKWKGKFINKETLRRYLCELNSYRLPEQLPPWQIMVIPLNGQTPSYAMMIRVHHLLAKDFLPSNLKFKSDEKSPYENKYLKNNGTFSQHLIMALHTLVKISSYLVEMPSVLINELLFVSYRLKRRSSSGNVSVCWIEPLNFQLLQKMADKSGMNTNGILISCITGSLRHYYSVMEGHIPECIIGAIPSSHNGMLDSFSPVFLPLTAMGSKCRLLQLHHEMARTQRMTSVLKTMVLKYSNRILPYPLAKVFLKAFMKHYSSLIYDYHIPLDIYGFQHDEVEMVYLWRPLFDPVGISFSLMYSEDKVAVCVKTDLSSIQRPDALLSYFVREVKDLAVDLNVKDRSH